MICSSLLTIRNGMCSINYEPQGKICKKKEEGDSAISNGQNSLPHLLISTKTYEHKSNINLEVLSLLLHGCVQRILLLLYSNTRIT